MKVSLLFCILSLIVILFNYATIIEANNEAMDEMLEERATLNGGKATTTSSLLHKKDPALFTKMMKKKGANGGGVVPMTPQCSLPACPTAPTGCSFSANDEKDTNQRVENYQLNTNGCLKYPCGVDLVCDSGKTFKAAKVDESKSLTDCVKNKNSKECRSICSNAMTETASSFVELMANENNSGWTLC